MPRTTLTGTVIHGTMRPQDLIPAFLNVLRKIAPDAYAQMIVSGGPIPAYVQDDGDSSDWWNGDDAAALLEGLFDTLDEHAPEGHYFGAHPGDGSDYGFWPSEE